MTTVNGSYAPTATKKTTFSTVILTSTAGDPDTWNNGYKDLADHLAWMQARAVADAAANAFRIRSDGAARNMNGWAEAGGGVMGWSNSAASGTIYAALVIPPVPLGQTGKTLYCAGFGCRYFGAGTTARTMPTVMPKLEIGYATSTGGALTPTLSSTVATDASANATAYTVWHGINVSGAAIDLGDPLLATRTHFLKLTAEGVTNFITGALAHGFYADLYYV